MSFGLLGRLFSALTYECSFKKEKLQSGLAFVQHCSTVRLGCIFEPLHMLERVRAHFKVNFNDYYSCTMLIQR